MALYTLGHSTLTKDAFQKAAGPVTTIIDIRSHPTSRWEQFRKEELEAWLPTVGLQYEWWPSLGGWDKRHSPYVEPMSGWGVDIRPYLGGKFPKQRIAVNEEASETPRWTNVGLRDYSYYTMLPEFLEGINKLIERGEREDVAYVCAEAVPWRCHRSMVSDCLYWNGVASVHLIPAFRQKDGIKYPVGYKTLDHSKMIGNRIERYEPPIVAAWQIFFKNGT